MALALDRAAAVSQRTGGACTMTLSVDECSQPLLASLYEVAREHDVRLGIRLRGLDSSSGPREGHLYVNPLEGLVAADEDITEFERVGDVIKERPWGSLTLSGHSDGAHLNLGDVYLCGLVGDEEARRDGEPIRGCTLAYCKKARPERPAVRWSGTSADVLALLGCNTLCLGGPVFPTTSSLLLSALAGGRFGNIVAVHGSFPAFKGIERDYLDRIRSGERLGEVVNALNGRSDLASYGSTVALIGDPDFRFSDVRRRTRRRSPVSGATPPTTAAAAPSGERSDEDLTGFSALADYARRALRMGERAGSLDPGGTAAVQEAIRELGAAPDASDDPLRVAGAQLSATRRLRIDPLYFGPALRPRGARSTLAREPCPQCSATVMVWADPHSGYQDRWCVTCGHLSAGTDSPDLSLRMSRVANELRVLCRSREPIGSLDLLVRDECRGEDIVLATLHGVGGELAADLALRSLPSEDAVTVHVLRHRAGALHSYRARSAGLTVARSFRLAWGDHAA